MKKLLIVLAVLLLAAPTMAAEWNFYGSARFATWSTDVDMDVAGEDSDRDTLWDQQGNSRIGATVKFNDEIGGAFEAGDSWNKRKLYGTYNFGAGQLLIGQTYTPSSANFYSNSVYNGDGDLLGIGQFYVGRVPMIQLSYGDLKLAFIKPNVYDYSDVLSELELEAYAGLIDTDVTIPKIELSYGYKGEMFFVDVFGGYQTYEIEISDVNYSQDIDAYVVGIGAGVDFGPAYLKAGFHTGENFGNYGQWNQAAGYFGTGYFWDKAIPYESGVVDSDGMGYLGVLGFKANDMLTFEAGYGYEETELDDSAVDVDYEAEIEQYYLNATINFTKGFFMVPEIGMIQYEEKGETEEPEIFYVGAKWQINF